MRAYNHLFISWRIFEEFLDGIRADRNKKQLVRVHSSVHNMESMQGLAKQIQDRLPNAVIIGCSTPGVICEGRIVKGSCLISVTEFENSEVKLGMFSCKQADGADKTGEALGEEISEQFVQGKKGLMLLFMPVTYYRTARFVAEMNRRNPYLKMCGGTTYAADENYVNAGNTAYVLAGTQTSVTDMAAVLISGEGLSVYENVICGIEQVGRKYEITGVEGNYLTQVENEDAAKWYTGLLGEEELMQDPSLAGLFPLIREVAGQQIAYNLVFQPYIELGSPYKENKQNRVSMFTEIVPGMKFALGYFEPQKIVNQLSAVYQELKEEPVEAMFAYDCLSRMWMLHDCATWEVGQFYTTNMSGALLAGEISNIENRNIYANSTFVVAGISENPEARLLLRRKALANVSALQHNNVQMINYLLKAGNKQLSKELSAQQEQMRQAMFWCEELGMPNQTRYIYECDKLGLDKIAVFNVKNDKLLRVFMGQTAFVEEWKKIYKKASVRFMTKGLHAYSYGDYSLMVAASGGVEDEEFVSCIREIYEYLNSGVYKDSAFTYSCAVVLHEEDALQKVEEAIQYGIRHKKNFVQYHEVPAEVISVKEEMHMLQVLREALAEDRIVPYFQGIHDNRSDKINLYEALMRIQDAQGKLYFPAQFLPVAKDYNLYETMSIMMVKKVMTMFLDKDVRVSINLNVQDIYDRDLLRTIFNGLEKAKHPENFIFELVESEEVNDYQFVKQFADSVHSHGAKMAIDDFGSGFANLLHIIRLDPDIVKLDGAIIKEIGNDEKCREFVELITEWCRRREKEVVAEFVENECIQQIMEEIGITYSQGYYYAKPETWENCCAKGE